MSQKIWNQPNQWLWHCGIRFIRSPGMMKIPLARATTVQNETSSLAKMLKWIHYPSQLIHLLRLRVKTMEQNEMKMFWGNDDGNKLTRETKGKLANGRIRIWSICGCVYAIAIQESRVKRGTKYVWELRRFECWLHKIQQIRYFKWCNPRLLSTLMPST